MSSASVQHPADQSLIAFNLGRLNDSKAVAVNKHLKNCPECRRRLVKLLGVTELPVQPPEKPNSDEEKVSETAATQSNPPERLPRIAFGQVPKFVWAAAAAGVVLLGLTVAWAAGAFRSDASAPVVDLGIRPESKSAQPTPAPAAKVPPIANLPPAKIVSKAETVAPPSVVPATPAPAVKESSKQETAKPEKASDAAVQTVADEKPPAQPPVAPEKEPNHAKMSQADFFNGKDLAGWQGPAGVWHVEQGEIVGTSPASAGQGKPSFLYSRQTFRDFDLKFQANVEEGIGDCGVYFRGQVIESEKQQVIGPLLAIYGKDPPQDRRTGSLIIEPQNKVEQKAPAKLIDRFAKPALNRFHLRCQGQHVLFEVNGIKTVNGEFPTLPSEGIIAWKLDANRPPRKVSIKITRFTDLTGAPSRSAPERPSLADAELLRAQMKFQTAVQKADEALMKQFEAEISKLQKGAKADETVLLPFVEHEKDMFKEKGLIPWSRPMRKAVALYGRSLLAAHKSVGNAFDAALNRAEKAHNSSLEEALIAEAGQLLAPRPVAIWQLNDKSQTHRTVFFSDASFVTDNQDDHPGSRFWQGPVEDKVVLESPVENDPTSTDVRVYRVTPDGKTLVALRKNGSEVRWQHLDE
jgi:Domain of Unknown Function (DUF1080)